MVKPRRVVVVALSVLAGCDSDGIGERRQLAAWQLCHARSREKNEDEDDHDVEIKQAEAPA